MVVKVHERHAQFWFAELPISFDLADRSGQFLLRLAEVEENEIPTDSHASTSLWAANGLRLSGARNQVVMRSTLHPSTETRSAGLPLRSVRGLYTVVLKG